MQQSSLLSLRHVSVSYANNTALNNVSLELNPQQLYTLIGPNGAGKSTLVKCILGLVSPTSGSIIRHQALQIGYVPQKLDINQNLPLTVERFLTLKPNTDTKEVEDALAQVDAAHLRRASMHTLSGGETQRVLLANAIVKKPNLLLLDEPLQGVDINGQIALYALIASLKQRLNCTVLMVSHDLHIVMAQTDQVICLHQHICCQGTPSAISSHPEYLARFGDKTQEMLALYYHHHQRDRHHA